MGGQTYAQKSWKSILSGVANAVVGNSSATTTATLVGTWKYTGPDCKFESDNLLAKAGGEVASARVEEKVSEVFQDVLACVGGVGGHFPFFQQRAGGGEEADLRGGAAEVDAECVFFHDSFTPFLRRMHRRIIDTSIT